MNLIELNFKRQLEEIIEDLYDIGLSLDVIHSERTRIAELGDYTSAVVLMLAKKTGQEKQVIAQAIKEGLEQLDNIDKMYKRVSITGPGFINVKLSDRFEYKARTAEINIDLAALILENEQMAGFSKMVRRIKNIVKVLEDEGYNDRALMQTKEDFILKEPFFLSDEWLKLYHLSNVLLTTDLDGIDKRLIYSTIEDLKTAFETIEDQVVYRKYSKEGLKIIYMIYCQIAYIFDKIT